MFYELAQSLTSGLLIGSALAVLSVGFSMAWGITHVLNVAHCAFAMLAAYLGYWSLSLWGIDPLLALPAMLPLFFVLGVAMHRLLIRTTARRAHDLGLATMVLTFGLGVVMENGMQLAWTPDPRVLKTAYSSLAFSIGPLIVQAPHLVAFGLATATIGALYLFAERTFMGKAVRAVWQQPMGAALSGIDLDRVTTIAYGLAVATSAVGGVAMSLLYTFDPATHLSWLVYVFLVVILGGVGSILGSALAGLIIGLIIGVSSVFVPLAWNNLVLFGLLILLLLLRPQGLLQR
ncbi:MAG: branched-chain amino acid ABC transporter permease [Roseiflexaceae bacterium]|nr:branched-chain amino acid ABC transporter permease [Roseiflexus sp.]MDW8214667.1 branched-chain amino acid ABC transporter permease [Roseiflexaceae bacterium]